jgi:putative heme degradation protein
MRTKDRVRAYREQHPCATVRDIQKALNISSPSVVHFHLTNDAKADKVALLRDALDACAKQLAHCLGPNTEAGRQAREALDATSPQ